VVLTGSLAMAAIGFWRGTRWAFYVNLCAGSFIVGMLVLLVVQLGSRPAGSWCPAPMHIETADNQWGVVCVH
jgi:hypothetical protein